MSNDLAKRVVVAPAPDLKFYNNNSAAFVSIFNKTLLTIATFKSAVLAYVKSSGSLNQATSLAKSFSGAGVNVIVGETFNCRNTTSEHFETACLKRQPIHLSR